MSNELVEVNDAAPAVASNTFDIVDVESAKAFMENYQELVEALLDSSDYQKIGNKQFKKKSAWRKLQTAFNISDEIVNEETTVDENNQIISSKFYVKATLPNGRSSVGVGKCSIYDKITKKDATQPSNFVLRNRFNNAEHDVPSTAHTRAKSRAISDLIGAGEVSAEEMDHNDGGRTITAKSKKTVTAKPKTKPKTVTPKKSTAKPKKEEPIETEAEVIETEVVGDGKSSKTVKDWIEEDNSIKMVVNELDEENRIINKESIKQRLLDKIENGALSQEAYEKAKRVME